MTNKEFELKFARLVKSERGITLEILQMVIEAEKKRHFLDLGFSNSFDWLTRGHGYSEPAANRRIQSARFLLAVPELETYIRSGECNLSTTAALQSAISKIELKTGKKYSTVERVALLEEIKGKSFDEVQKHLASKFPLSSRRELIKWVSDNEARLSLNFSGEGLGSLKRVRELLSHTLIDPSWSELVCHLANDYLERKDPAHKKSDSAKRRVKIRAGNQCEFVDPTTGRRCTSRYQLEIDHIQPKALGGSDDEENLRVLCKQHNLYEARRILGPMAGKQGRP